MLNDNSEKFIDEFIRKNSLNETPRSAILFLMLVFDPLIQFKILPK